MGLGVAFFVVGLAMFAYGTYRALTAEGGKFVNRSPRLEDRKITASAYGITMKMLYGTDRISGNIIWASDIRELEHKDTETVGGKGGGPSSSVTNLTYTYWCDFAISFAVDPMPSSTPAVLRIWFDSDLVYNATADTLEPVQMPGLQFRFYSGTGTQEPDSLIQSVYGPSDVPGQRDEIYIVFENTEITRYGRIPNVTAEITTNSSENKTTTSDGTSQNANINLVYHQTRNSVYAFENIPGDSTKLDWWKYDLAADSVTQGQITGLQESINEVTMPVVDEEGFIWFGGENGYVSKFDPDSNTVVWQGQHGGVGGKTVLNLAPVYDPNLPVDNQRWLYITSGTAGTGTHGWLCRDDLTFRGSFESQPYSDPWRSLAVNGMSEVWTATNEGWPSNPCIVDYTIWFYDEATFPNLPHPNELQRYTWTISSQVVEAAAMGLDTVNRKLYILGKDATTSPLQGALFRYDVSEPHTITNLTSRLEQKINDDDLPYGTIHVSATGINSNRLNVIAASKYEPHIMLGGLDTSGPWGFTITILNLLDFQLLYQFNLDDWPDLPVGGNLDAWWLDPFSYSLIASAAELNGPMYRFFLHRKAGGLVLLSDVVKDIGLKCDIPAADHDTTTIDPYYVRGYTVASRGQAVHAMEPLMAAYVFDVIESDFKLKMVRRGTWDGSPAGTITEDEHSSSEDKAPEASTTTVLPQDPDLPSRIDIRYIDQTLDYQENVQHAVRPLVPTAVMNSRERGTSELGLVFTPDEAKQVAENWMKQAWAENFAKEFTAIPKHILFDPSDVITLVDFLDPTSSWLLRIEEQQIGRNFEIECKCVTEAVPSATTLGAGGLGFTPSAIPFAQPTLLEIMDIPLLQDQDEYSNSSGLYFALKPQSGTWPGAIVFESENNTSWAPVANGSTGAAWGTALEALPAPDADPNGSPRVEVWDRTNTLTVFMPQGDTLATAASELAVLNGENVAILGDEVIQWVTATQPDPGGDPNRWQLTTLLRGRRGTEWAVDDHIAGDRFVVLTTSTILRAPVQYDDIGQHRFYRAVTEGSSVDATQTTPLDTFQGRDRMPYSPAYVRADRDASRNMTIKWLRRSRKNHTLPYTTSSDGSIPLNEESEAYELEVLDSSDNVVRTFDMSDITLSTDPDADGYNGTCSYTAAQQVADFGSVQLQLSVRVYQMSAIVGRGFPAERVI